MHAWCVLVAGALCQGLMGLGWVVVTSLAFLHLSADAGWWLQGAHQLDA